MHAVIWTMTFYELPFLCVFTLLRKDSFSTSSVFNPTLKHFLSVPFKFRKRKFVNKHRLR